MHPILFRIGPLTVYSYGTVVALAFLITAFLLTREARESPFITPNQVLDILLYGLISGIIGARLLHVILNIEIYLKNPIEILFINKGGLAFYGGIGAAVGSSLYFLIKRKIPVWKAGDLIAPYLALGHAIGRVGCFLNGCCFGKSAEFMLAVMGRHPTQLYSSACLLLIFFILRSMYGRRHSDGQVFSSYLILYSVFRFFMDFLRGDIFPVLLGLTASQLISIFIFVIGITILLFRTTKNTK